MKYKLNVCDVSFTDGERPIEGTDTSRKRDSRSSDKYHKNEDASNSQEDENTVRLFNQKFKRITGLKKKCA